MRRVLSVTAALLVLAMIPTAAADDVKFTALLGLGRVKRDAGDASAARQYFEAARAVHPFDAAETSEYFWVLADTAPADAVSLAAEILKGDPRAAKVRDKAITLAVEVGDDDRAIAFSRLGQAISSDTALWPRHLGEVYLRMGRPAEASLAYRQAASLPDATERDRVGLALALEAAGDNLGALAAWNTVSPRMVGEKREWMEARLRLLAAAPDAAGAAEIEAWVDRHPDDRAMRGQLVELWAAAGEPRQALAFLAPLTNGVDAPRWLRREADLAVGADDRARAIRAIERLQRAGAAALDDHWRLVDLLLDTGDEPRAATMLARLSSGRVTCADGQLERIDRLADPRATDMLLAALASADCQPRARWIQRGVERTVALSRHHEALALMARLSPEEQQVPSALQLRGDLLLWTGDAAGAIAVLHPIIAAHSGDDHMRLTLIHAHRVLKDPRAAWAIADPLRGRAATLTPEDLSILAELALDVDQPAAAERLAERLPDRTASERANKGALLGRAAFDSGRGADALVLLSRIPSSQLSPRTALTMLDAAIAVHGPAGASAIASPFTNEGADWVDIMARRALIAESRGETREQQRLASVVHRLDPRRGALLSVEFALQRRDPAAALAAVTALPADNGVADDLRSTALAGLGRYADARRIVEALLAAHPESAVLRIRATDLAWRQQPSSAAFAAVAALPGRFPDRLDAAITAARALAAAGDHEEVIALLGRFDRDRASSQEALLLLARSLHSIGKSTDALRRLETLASQDLDVRLLAAQLRAVVDGAAAADAEFRRLSADSRVTPAVFAAWADVLTSSAARQDVLERGVRRFPLDRSLLSALASTRWVNKDVRGAREAAATAVDIDSTDANAWAILIQAALETDRNGVAPLLERFHRSFSEDGPQVVRMAETLTGRARTSTDPTISIAIEWLSTDPATRTEPVRRDLALARAYSRRDDWTNALSAIERLLVEAPDSPEGLRLRADVLSYAGRYDNSVAAYDAYLAVAPRDVAARRQQARVAGWGGRFDEARRLYDAVRRDFPADATVAAEAQAKVAFFTGRWDDAAKAYAEWAAHEPDNGEAQFEWAASERALGRLKQADDRLRRLEDEGGHQLAAALRQRIDASRQPSVGWIEESRHANGYAGQRLLDLHVRGVAGRFGLSDRVQLRFGGGDLIASGDWLRTGRFADGALTLATQSLRFDAQARISDIGEAVGPLSALARASWRRARWTIDGGLAQAVLQENVGTIQRGTALWGPFAGTRLMTPRGSFDAHASWQRLTDGNERRQWTVSADRTFSESTRGLRWLVWSEGTYWRDGSADYFAPPHFFRLDAGAQYTAMLSRPRFAGDRQRTVSAGYLIGTDNRGTLYQHPSADMTFELRRSVLLRARADAILSSVYRERAWSVSIVLGGTPQP